mmetsp:Transcript_113624/g.197431  ORF Transcript_113624/g.197431 Transcript_113624/m.197431 type:complete len:233 (-) Transcript_113624:160-858(-)
MQRLIQSRPMCRTWVAMRHIAGLPDEMSPFAKQRLSEEQMLKHSGAGESCAPAPPGGDMTHMQGPEADAQTEKFIHKLTDSFILSRPIPKNPRQAALAKLEEEDEQVDQDNIYTEMVRSKYREMKRKERSNGMVGGITNRFAQQIRAETSKTQASASGFVPGSGHMPSVDTASVSDMDELKAILKDEDRSAVPRASSKASLDWGGADSDLRRLKYQIEMLRKQLLHQQQHSA